MDQDFEVQFNCLGRFFDAKNIPAFRNVLGQTLQQTLGETTVSVELLDHQNAPRETDINVSFINSVTKQSAFEFVHYRDNRGRPDSVIVDAVLSYDIIANTIPPVAKRNVLFMGGEHNVIDLKTPQGHLQMSQRNYSEYGGPVAVLVRRAGKPAVIHTQTITGRETYLAGDYDLEVLTLPRIRRKVEILPDQTTTLNIAAPGVLNINTNVTGHGSLYVDKQ